MSYLPDPIEMIRGAERSSEESISRANSEANQIVHDAKKGAEVIIADSLKTSADANANSVASAHQANKALMEKFTIELDEEIRSLRDSSKDKLSKAIDLVCDAIV